MVSCGNEHTVALSSEGEMYSWGKNTQGQLGIGYTSQSMVQSSSAMRINSICTKPILLNQTGQQEQENEGLMTKMMNWIRDSSNNSPLPDESEEEIEQIQLPMMIDVYCETVYSFSVDVDNRCWAWGSSLFGELGIGEAHVCCPAPFLLENLPPLLPPPRKLVKSARVQQ